MIWKLVRRNIAATRGRLLLMLLSIVLGVSFVSGSFLLADSLRAIFGDISEQIFAGVDVQVRAAENELSTSEDGTRFDESVIDQVRDLPEVEFAEGGLFAFEQGYTVGDDGEVHRPTGPPVFTASWVGPSPVSSWTLTDGRAPSGLEIAIDETQASDHDLAIGDTVGVVGPGLDEQITVDIVGTVVFGEGNSGPSAYFNLFDLETAQLVLDADGLVDGINLHATDGVSNAQLISAVQEATGFDESLDAVPGSTLVDEQNAEFDVFIDIIGWVLLGFAIAVLFVSIFIIYNTFAILIGQRIRQFGLLRSIGMTGRQIRNMVVIEALIIGVAASIIGLFGGIAIAEGLKWLFTWASGGNSFPDGPLIFRTRTIAIVFVLGIGVTLASAVLPAWLAQRIPALAALRDGALAAQSSRRRRVTVGGVIFGLGALAMLWGLFGSFDGVAARLSLLGVGAALLFIGTAALSVLFASAVTDTLGAPIEAATGLTGRLGRDNASRNPQRTAATATALMIGLALITGVLVLTASLRTSFEKVLDETLAADLLVAEENQNLPFAAVSVDQLAATPEIGDVAGVANVKVRIDGEAEGATGFDVATEDRVIDLQVTEGSYGTGGSGLLVFRDEAEERGLSIGSTITATFEDDFVDTFEVVGLFEDNTLVGSSFVFDRAVTAAHTNIDTVNFLGATFADGVDPDEGRDAAAAALENFPQLGIQDNSEFKESLAGQINAILYLIFGLLALCIVVAFIGIVNTMALSILERTREIGLLRAVGTSRRQLRAMVRWEAIIVGVFGAIMGVVLGVVIGIAAVTAIPDSFVSEVSIPWVWAIAFMIIGGLLGMAAAIRPARRAANMNVLDAISSM